MTVSLWILVSGTLDYLQPSLPRLAVAPVWEPPYRRKNIKDWIPDFEQVSISHVFESNIICIGMGAIRKVTKHTHG